MLKAGPVTGHRGGRESGTVGQLDVIVFLEGDYKEARSRSLCVSLSSRCRRCGPARADSYLPWSRAVPWGVGASACRTHRTPSCTSSRKPGNPSVRGLGCGGGVQEVLNSSVHLPNSCAISARQLRLTSLRPGCVCLSGKNAAMRRGERAAGRLGRAVKGEGRGHEGGGARAPRRRPPTAHAALRSRLVRLRGISEGGLETAAQPLHGRSRFFCFDRSDCARYAQTLCLGCALTLVRAFKPHRSDEVATAIRAPSCRSAGVRGIRHTRPRGSETVPG